MAAQAVLAHHELQQKIEELTPHDNVAGRRAEILVKENDLRVTLVTMRAGIQLDEHATPVSITIQVLQGEFEVLYEGGSVTLGAGGFISLRKEVRHTVRAISDGAFLLTLGWDSPEIGSGE